MPTDRPPERPELSPAQLWHHYTRYPYILAKLLLVAIAVTLGVVVFRALEAVLVPVLISLLLAYLLDPIVDWLQARGLGRTAGIGLLLMAGGAFLAIFVLFLYPPIAHALGRISEGLPKLIKLLEEQLLPWLQATLGLELPASLSAVMEQYGGTLREQIPSVANKVGATLADVWTHTGSIAASLVNLVMIPIFTFYFLRDFDGMRDELGTLLPQANRQWTVERLHRMDDVVGAWFRGQVEVAVILAVLYAIGLGLVFAWAGIGASAGIAIGVLAGLLNIVPYFGFLIGIILAVLMVVLEWGGIGPLVGVFAVFGVVQAMEGYLITPRIVGDKVGLSPVVVIISLLIGGELLGLMGVLLALPCAGILRVLLPDMLAYYRRTNFFTGELRGAVPVPGTTGGVARPPGSTSLLAEGKARVRPPEPSPPSAETRPPSSETPPPSAATPPIQSKADALEPPKGADAAPRVAEELASADQSSAGAESPQDDEDPPTEESAPPPESPALAGTPPDTSAPGPADEEPEEPLEH